MYTVKEELIPHNKEELKKEVDHLMSLSGNVKGEVLKTTFAYIEMREGPEGVKKIEDVLSEIGYPFSYKAISSYKWYKESYSISIYLSAIVVLGWKQEDIYNLASSALGLSFLLRLIVKQFISLRQIFEESPKYWDRHLDFGSFVPLELDEDKKYITFFIEGYKFHPISNVYHSGYVDAVMKLSVKSEEIIIKVVKSVYDGEPHTEFLGQWR
jgi:hypothetical protein